MSRSGYYSPKKAADVLGVHHNTVRSWAHASIDGRESRLQNVERHPLTGYLYIPGSEVDRLKKDPDGDG